MIFPMASSFSIRSRVAAYIRIQRLEVSFEMFAQSKHYILIKTQNKFEILFDKALYHSQVRLNF